MRKTFFACCIFLFTAISSVHATSIVISASPSAGQVNVGQIIGVSIDISGLDSSVALGSYDLDLGFDPAILHFDNAVFGDPTLGDQLDLANLGFNFPSATVGVNSVNLIEFSLDSLLDLLTLQSDQFTLATLFFTGLSSGVSPFDLTLNSLADGDANPIIAGTLNNSVNVTAVPEPATFWLIGTGLAFLWSKSKKRT